MPRDDEEAPVKKGRRRTFRLLRWVAAAGMLGLVLAIGAGVALYSKRTMVVNLLLKKFTTPFSVAAGEIDVRWRKGIGVTAIKVDTPGGVVSVGIEEIEFDGLDKVTLGGIEVVRPGSEAAPMLTVGSLEVDYGAPDWRNPASWSIDSIRVVEPVAKLDEAGIAAIEGLIAAVVGKDPEKPTEKSSREIVIGSVAIEGGRVEAEFEKWGVPRVAFDLAAAGRGLRVSGGGALSDEPVRLSLKNVVVGEAEAGGMPIAALPAVELAVLAGEGFRGGKVEAFSLDGLELRLTPEVLEAFGTGAGDEAAPAEPEPESRGAKGKEGWVLEGVAIRKGKFELKGFDKAEDRPLLPDLSFGFEGDLAGLRFGGGDGISEQKQSLRLAEVVVDARAADGEGADEMAARISSILVEIVPDHFLSDGRIEAMRVERPSFKISPATVGRFSGKGEEDGAATGKAAEAEPAAATADERKIFRVIDLAVTAGTFSVDPRLAGLEIPLVGGTFEVKTREGEGGEGDARYRLSAGDIRLKNPDESVEDLLRVNSVEIDFSAKGLQGGKRIDGISVQGTNVAIDDALTKMLGTKEGEVEAAPVKEAQAGKDSPFQGWTLGALRVYESRIKISDLLPDIPPISFAVRIEEDELTLGDDRSETGEKKRKVEIERVEIPSPRNTFVKVADLRNIFIEFTLKGLLEREIEEIHIADPRLYVGEHLFWYVEYTRKFNEEREAALKRAEAEGIPAAPSEGAWKVNRFVARNGKLIVAPKGYPIGGIQPFPFNVETDFESGEIDLELVIEDGTYTLSQLGVELTLVGLNGKAIFNVPIKQEDNNLWQYFYVDSVQFRDYRAENVELALTYYADGISAKFGGNAYSGYVNGGVNVYFGEKYSWDAWLAGTEVEMGPITRIAAPENFLMEATVSCQIVGGGVELAPGLLDAYISDVSPGRFEITKLNELLRDLPAEWNDLKKQAAEIGVQRLRDFDFDEGGGGVGYLDSSIKLVNELKVSEYFKAIDFPEDEAAGFLTLDLKGDEGIRSLHLDYFDRTSGRKVTKAPLSASNP